MLDPNIDSYHIRRYQNVFGSLIEERTNRRGTNRYEGSSVSIALNVLVYSKYMLERGHSAV